MDHLPSLTDHAVRDDVGAERCKRLECPGHAVRAVTVKKLDNLGHALLAPKGLAVALVSDRE